MEVWEDSEDANLCPANADEEYKLTLGYIKDNAKKSLFLVKSKKVQQSGLSIIFSNYSKRISQRVHQGPTIQWHHKQYSSRNGSYSSNFIERFG